MENTFKLHIRYMDGKETVLPHSTFDTLKFTIEDVVLPGLAVITRIAAN